MFRIFFFLLFLLVLPDLFVWWNFTRLHSGIWRTVLLVLPTVLTLLCMLLLVCQVRVSMLLHLAFLLIICISVPKLVFVVAELVGRGLTWGHAGALPVVHRVALALSVAMAAVQVYGTAWGWRRLVVESRTVRVSGLPAAFDGYRVIQISDLHLGTYAGDTTFVSHLVDSINGLRPDLIVFTGDLVNTASAEVLPFVRVLSRLRAADGVYSVLGNHDYCMYQPGLKPEAQRQEVQRIVRAQRAMGWDVLRNERRAVVRGSDTLHVIGVENTGKPPFPEYGDLPRAVEGLAPEACALLLSHDPWHWRHGVVGDERIALTLSGHTHALQMQVGHFSPAAWIMPEWGGLYSQGRQQLFVSTGIGGSVPYRLGAWPKIELLTLRK